MLHEAREIDFVLWLQGVDGVLEPVMKLFTQLGYLPVFTLAAAVVFWSIDSRLGRRMAIFFYLAGALTGDTPAFSIDLAQRVLGWAPKHSWRTELG